MCTVQLEDGIMLAYLCKLRPSHLRAAVRFLECVEVHRDNVFFSILLAVQCILPICIAMPSKPVTVPVLVEAISSS